MVGAGRFERPTPCAQGRCATRLRYAPTSEAFLILNLSIREKPQTDRFGRLGARIPKLSAILTRSADESAPFAHDIAAVEFYRVLSDIHFRGDLLVQ